MEMKSAALMKVLVFGVFFIAGHTLFWRGKDNDPLLYFRINTELCHPLQWSGKLFLQTATNRLHFLGCLKNPNPRSIHLRIGSRISPPASAMSAAYPSHHPRAQEHPLEVN